MSIFSDKLFLFMEVNKMRRSLSQLSILFFLFCFGGFTYYTIEIICRGFSHFSMFIVGGLCFVIIGLINEGRKTKYMLFQYQCLIGAGIITVLEFISGCIVNLLLHWNVWDYSDRAFNLFGQICLHHSVCYWIPLSALSIIVDDMLRGLMFDEDIPEYRFRNKKR